MEMYLVVVLILSILAIIKNENTFTCRKIIGDAIFMYQMHQLRSGDILASRMVDYDDCESYNSTFLRFWDWGYTRILPPDKFDIIKPYLFQRMRGYL